jgi:flavin reductase (DIM6/NTAB) family NADH-FMN oxidoreductase RutF
MTGDAERDFLEFGRGRDAPMYIVTVSTGRERAGCLMGFATQVSISPGRFLACLSIKNHTYRVGTPLLDDCPGRFLGAVLDRLDLGDHTGYVLEPVAAWPDDGPQLTMRHAMEIHPGHEP